MLLSELLEEVPADLVAKYLETNPDYRILRRFTQRTSYHEEAWNLGDPAALKLGLFVDCETTGLDREEAQVIEFGAVPFSYEPKSGLVCEVLHRRAISAFEEPAGGVPEEITDLTGITDEMVKGQRLPAGKITELVTEAGIIIAHNAEYDRPILEKRIPAFERAHWACSQKEIPWHRFNVVGQKLANILASTCGLFYEAHRALDDCLAGVHILASAQLQERNAMSYLLESARQPTIRLWALDSPFPKKEKLKSRRPNRYRWSDGKGRHRKGWFTDIKPADVELEKEWLLVEIYSGRVEERHALAIEQFGSKDRYSARLNP